MCWSMNGAESRVSHKRTWILSNDTSLDSSSVKYQRFVGDTFYNRLMTYVMSESGHYDDCPLWQCPACGVEWVWQNVLPDIQLCSCDGFTARHHEWMCQKCAAFVAQDCTDLAKWQTPSAYQHTRWSIIDSNIIGPMNVGTRVEPRFRKDWPPK